MIKLFLAFSTLLLLLGCSSTEPKNEWQFQSVNAYESSKHYFLKDDVALANTDLKRAKKYAKQSADLTTLLHIELSQCALHKAVLDDDNCSTFKQLQPLVLDKKSDSYYLFINKQYTKEDIENLPKQYQEFAEYLLKRDFKNASLELLVQEDLLSKMLMASLLKENLSLQNIKSLIDQLSLYGYKKGVISWLEYYKTRLIDKNDIEEVNKRVTIMQN
jgi:hypothetical protein